MTTLTERERVILEFIALDRTPHQIAELLGSEYNTVRTHTGALEIKLGVHSQRGLASWAWRSGWMERDPTWALRRMGL